MSVPVPCGEGEGGEGEAGQPGNALLSFSDLWG